MRLFRAETNQAEKGNRVRFKKKSRRDKMMRSKSFETLEEREIGRKEAGELRDFPILWNGMVEDVYRMEGKECKNQDRLKMCLRKFMLERGRCFSME